ncbi:MAG: hypothetical protein N2322_04185, partial [Terrimicrobiaceae bacterium]|nr:hypothetical protein [Terrimicrobiaceae bacterium]
MSRLCAMVVGGMVPLAAWAGGLDLRYPPTSAQREELLAKGWEAARDALEQELLAAYHPGMGQRAGSTGIGAYRQWLLLWKWCELLSRNCEREARALAARHLFEKPGEERPVFCPPSLSPGPEYEPARPEVVSAVWEGSRRELLGQLLPSWLPEPADAPLASFLDVELVKTWVADPVISEALFGLLQPEDYAPGVLANLQAMARAQPGKFREYASLALALAVVYDVRFPDTWPHHQ